MMDINQILHLSGYQYMEQRFDEAEKTLRRGLAEAPNDARIYYNLAILKSVQGQFAECTAACEKCLDLDPHFSEAADLLGHQLLREGRWPEGFALFEARFAKQQGIPFFKLPIPVWDGRPNAFIRRLLVWGEQGLGDTVQFARLIEPLRAHGFEVTFVCHPELLDLMAESQVADEYFSLEAMFNGELPPTPCQAHIPIMSLGRILGVTVDQIPGRSQFLQVAPHRLETARREMAELAPTRRPRVGLVWAGSNSTHPEFQMTSERRRIPLYRLKSTLEVEGIDFFSLQVGQHAIAQEEFAQIKVPRLTKSYADTAAWMKQMDLVISIDTSAVHVASAVGVPVWMLSRYDICWRWLENRQDSTWYPKLRIYRQLQMGDWSGIVKKITTDLSDWKKTFST